MISCKKNISTENKIVENMKKGYDGEEKKDMFKFERFRNTITPSWCAGNGQTGDQGGYAGPSGVSWLVLAG